MKKVEYLRLDSETRLPENPLTNDWFFYKVFEDLSLTKDLLERIICKKIERIYQYESQREEKYDSKHKPSIRFDVYCIADKQPVNIEIQNASVNNLRRRARVYSSMLDRNLSWDEKEKEYIVPDSWTIWFIDGSVGSGPAYRDYTMQCVCAHDVFPLDDGRHVVFIDYSRFNEAGDICSDLCRLMRGEENDTLFGARIKDRVYELLCDEEVRRSLVSFEEKLQQREERGIEKGIKQGEDRIIFKFLAEAVESGDKNQLKRVLKTLEMTPEEATSFYNEYKAKLRQQE